MPPGTPVDGYVAHRNASEDQLKQWAEAFHRDGYLFLKSVLPPDWCAELCRDLDEALGPDEPSPDEPASNIFLNPRMFEMSDANLRLFDVEPIVSLAEALVAPNCHVIHNNSFTTRHGGGISTWHQDDAPHYVVTHGEPPQNVRLPVLFFTANYYLTDVLDRDIGGTEVVPRSHMFGASPPADLEDTEWDRLVEPNLGPAGSVVLFNNQVWHRGGPNRSDQKRYITQITYGRRMIGHKYYPFMNYMMPEHVYADADPRLRRLLGFLEHGAYG